MVLKRTAGSLIALAYLMIGIVGCSRTKSNAPETQVAEAVSGSNIERFSFIDVSQAVSLKHRFSNGEEAGERSILETIGGGVAVCDYDLDGFEDLYFASGGKLENKTVTGFGGSLHRNCSARQFVDVTQIAIVGCENFYTQGITSGDVNNDGFDDLLVTGYFGLALLVNQGDGTFSDQTVRAGLVDPKWGTSAAMVDIDSDGFLDIYIVHYVDWSFSNHPDCNSAGKPDVCAPGFFKGQTDVLWQNDGQGAFVDKTVELGIAPEGKGMGVIAADFTGDSKIDIYVTNDTTDNRFYINNGGVFEEIGLANGTAVDDMGTPQGSMGLCGLDFDSDLRLDIMVSNYENQSFALYKNDGNANFRYATSSAGLLAMGTSYVAWGSTASDFDLDGYEEIAIANGHVMISNPPDQLPLFLTNKGNSKLQSQKFPSDSYFSNKWRGRGVAAFDLDSDGDLDLVFTHINQDAALLRNETTTSGTWWILKLIGVHSNRNAIGARVIIETDKRKILRTIVGGGSFLSQGPYSIHWGLPKDEVAKRVLVYWPSGIEQALDNLTPNARLTVIESGP